MRRPRRAELAAGDLVIIAGRIAEYVTLERHAERAVDRTGGDRRIVPPVALPEQHRAAQPAEAALRVIARAVPGEPVIAGQRQLVVIAGGCRHIGSGLLAALHAVAGDHRAKLAADLE